MPRQLTPQSTLENLKREAKRWLRALRANVAEARTRLERALPNAPSQPTLRDVQRALAREHGLSGWAALKNRLATPQSAEKTREQIVHWFLENACPDHHVRSRPAHRMARHTAMRILEHYPDIAHYSLHTAVVCGDVAEVDRILAERPRSASEKSSETAADRSDVGGAGDLFRDIGPKGWEPLLYLSFTRLPLASANDNALAVARALLDHGADPNSSFMAGSSRYTPLVGVIGEGEEDRPPHPQRDALAKLFLQRGANPYDIQVIYNVGFHGDFLWFLKLIYDESVKRGQSADWDDPEWSMLDMGGYGSGARFLLGNAVGRNNLESAEWMLAHGANPNAVPPRDRRMSKRSLFEEAVRNGFSEMAELLARHGATRSEVALEGIEAFSAACFRLDRETAQALLEGHPEYLKSTQTIFAAAKQDRSDVVELLLDFGVSADVHDRENQRALHIAAYDDSIRVGSLLLERGAEVDPVESRWGNTPLDAAVHSDSARMIDLLCRVSRDVWNLSFTGKIERLREVFATEPELARVSSKQYGTPLFWLPEDEAKAIEVVELFLANGADPSLTNADGQTAADRADRRGLFDAAERLRMPSTPQTRPALEQFETMAANLLEAYRSGDPAAMQRHWNDTWHMRSWKAMRTYVQLDLGKRPESEGQDIDISLDDARLWVARDHGFKSWQELSDYLTRLPAGKSAIAATPVTPFRIDSKGKKQSLPSDRDWDAVIDTMREHRIQGLDANGQMTDAILERISRVDHVTSLDLSNSRKVTDSGLQYLARMPQLQNLDLSGSSITDRGLDVLRELPELRTFRLVHQHGVTDSGVANLSRCENLALVDLMGTATGDGAVKALTGKRNLRHFKSGNAVTDAGLALFHDFPVFKTWQGGEISRALLDFAAEPNHLMVRGPFTDDGLANLVGLDGLFSLNVDSSVRAITGAGLVPLAHLPNLGSLAFDATDESMPYIAALPHLRFLSCQDTVAGDDGFVALSRSQTIEQIWGRRCHNLRARGFAALSRMPSLRSLSVSCKNVKDAGLSTLPDFPALVELMPMDVPDDGYRHVGKCEKLESLILMYCRETTDAATGHIAALPRLTRYFASYTRITDRTPEILGTIESLERVEFSSCAGVTTAGVARLNRLPRLREVSVSGMPKVSAEIVAAFPANVLVKYSP
jgi:ankyrin repeat protein